MKRTDRDGAPLDAVDAEDAYQEATESEVGPLEKGESISRIMDKAQRAGRQALFDGLQAAVVALIDIKHGSPFTTDETFAQIERAIDHGRP